MPEKARLSIDVDQKTRKRIRLAAARKDVTLRDYVMRAVEMQLEKDEVFESRDSFLTLDADPVLSELWNNEQDAIYDAV
ncbi:MAG: hypothetical protein HYU64_20585 [Armatimonadetes bacterium]|nr:hypothetical protein [Armatimonadota bacterium]